MDTTIIKNINSGIEKKCDILRKNENYLEVVLHDTTIKILLKKKNNMYTWGNIKIWNLFLLGINLKFPFIFY